METQSLPDTADHPSLPRGPTSRAPRPASSGVEVDVAALSHAGLVRPNNEDHHLVVRAGRFLQTLTTSLPEGDVPVEYGDDLYGMVVADGMGGSAAGEVASRLAITALVRLVLETPDWIVPRDDTLMNQVVRRMEGRFRDVNAEVVEHARENPALAGMGTTLTLAGSLGAELFVAHVGDSRVFLLRGGELHPLTRLHTKAQALADIGAIPAEEVATHRFSHVLTHCIGRPWDGSAPEARRYRLDDGDRLLLCSDGLTDMVDDATIAAELQRPTNSGEACRSLVDLALKAGGRDNVTVIVAGYRIPPEDADSPDAETGEP